MALNRPSRTIVPPLLAQQRRWESALDAVKASAGRSKPGKNTTVSSEATSTPSITQMETASSTSHVKPSDTNQQKSSGIKTLDRERTPSPDVNHHHQTVILPSKSGLPPDKMRKFIPRKDQDQLAPIPESTQQPDWGIAPSETVLIWQGIENPWNDTHIFIDDRFSDPNEIRNESKALSWTERALEPFKGLPESVQKSIVEFMTGFDDRTFGKSRNLNHVKASFWLHGSYDLLKIFKSKTFKSDLATVLRLLNHVGRWDVINIFKRVAEVLFFVLSVNNNCINGKMMGTFSGKPYLANHPLCDTTDGLVFMFTSTLGRIQRWQPMPLDLESAIYEDVTGDHWLPITTAKTKYPSAYAAVLKMISDPDAIRQFRTVDNNQTGTVPEAPGHSVIDLTKNVEHESRTRNKRPKGFPASLFYPPHNDKKLIALLVAFCDPDEITNNAGGWKQWVQSEIEEFPGHTSFAQFVRSVGLNLETRQAAKHAYHGLSMMVWRNNCWLHDNYDLQLLITNSGAERLRNEVRLLEYMGISSTMEAVKLLGRICRCLAQQPYRRARELTTEILDMAIRSIPVVEPKRLDDFAKQFLDLSDDRKFQCIRRDVARRHFPAAVKDMERWEKQQSLLNGDADEFGLHLDDATNDPDFLPTDETSSRAINKQASSDQEIYDSDDILLPKKIQPPKRQKKKSTNGKSKLASSNEEGDDSDDLLLPRNKQPSKKPKNSTKGKRKVKEKGVNEPEVTVKQRRRGPPSFAESERAKNIGLDMLAKVEEMEEDTGLDRFQILTLAGLCWNDKGVSGFPGISEKAPNDFNLFEWYYKQQPDYSPPADGVQAWFSQKFRSYKKEFFKDPTNNEQKWAKHVQGWRDQRERMAPTKTAHDAMIWLRDTITDLMWFTERNWGISGFGALTYVGNDPAAREANGFYCSGPLGEEILQTEAEYMNDFAFHWNSVYGADLALRKGWLHGTIKIPEKAQSSSSRLQPSTSGQGLMRIQLPAELTGRKSSNQQTSKVARKRLSEQDTKVIKQKTLWTGVTLDGEKKSTGRLVKGRLVQAVREHLLAEFQKYEPLDEIATVPWRKSYKSMIEHRLKWVNWPVGTPTPSTIGNFARIEKEQLECLTAAGFIDANGQSRTVQLVEWDEDATHKMSTHTADGQMAWAHLGIWFDWEGNVLAHVKSKAIRDEQARTKKRSSHSGSESAGESQDAGSSGEDDKPEDIKRLRAYDPIISVNDNLPESTHQRKRKAQEDLDEVLARDTSHHGNCHQRDPRSVPLPQPPTPGEHHNTHDTHVADIGTSVPNHPGHASLTPLPSFLRHSDAYHLPAVGRIRGINQPPHHSSFIRPPYSFPVNSGTTNGTFRSHDGITPWSHHSTTYTPPTHFTMQEQHIGTLPQSQPQVFPRGEGAINNESFDGQQSAMSRSNFAEYGSSWPNQYHRF